jgi:hypothetical protein
MNRTRILVVDGNAGWVRSLFLAMRADVEVAFVRAYHPGFFKAAVGKSIVHGRGRGKIQDNIWDEYALIAGWTRFGGVSERLLLSRCRKIIRRWGGCEAVVFTLPQYAGVAERMTGVPRIYYAFDPYEYYEWDKAVTRATEDRLLATCETSVAISRKLEDDFRPRVRGALAYSPNAVSDSFVAALRAGVEPPADIAALPRPIIGCTGQINMTYDMDLIEALSAKLPHMTFVFVGGIVEGDPGKKARIESVLSRPNVKWLGQKDHKTLPAYIGSFDICFNPLAVTPHNDRRSPLRLYDYLATDRPILSTAVAEAAVHGNLISVGRTADECAALMTTMTGPAYAVDLASRHAYIARNTWSARARQFLEFIGPARPAAGVPQ